MNMIELEKYLDKNSYEIYKSVFFTNDELNELLIKYSLKESIDAAKKKTINDLLSIKINNCFYKFNSLLFEYNNYDIDNTIDHMKYMLKKQYLNLIKMSLLIDKTEDIKILRYIFLNLNAMLLVSNESFVYFSNLLKMMECEAKGITYLPSFKVDLSVNESKMNSITSNVKKLIK